ncbi:MAG: RDD family protein [Hydrogenophaga sp.]|nr:RDD family protein [Hydrogenophaga sp.]
MSRSKNTNKKFKTGADLILAPGFFRQFAAMLYDFLLLVAILFVATALLLPFNSGAAATDSQLWLYRLYLLSISFLFYGWFWTHGGQTLGLRAWKIKVLTLDKQVISWPQAGLRFVCAVLSWMTLGCGFLWILIDKNKRSWHDHLSKTAVFFEE